MRRSGCLHVRPVINLKTEEGVRKFEAIAKESGRAWCWNSAARFRASMAMGWCAVRLCEADVRRRDLRGVSRDQADVRSGGIFNPGKIVDAPPITVESALRRRGIAARNPQTCFRFCGVWRIGRARWKCAAAWARAARSWPGRCVLRIWRRARKRIPRGDARTFCGWRWRDSWAKQGSAMRACSACWICAWSAARANRNVRWASIWRGSRASFSRIIGRGTGRRCGRSALGDIDRVSEMGQPVRAVVELGESYAADRSAEETLAEMEAARRLRQWAERSARRRDGEAGHVI